MHGAKMRVTNHRGQRYRDSYFFSSRRRHTRLQGDWSSDVCSSDLLPGRGSDRRIAVVLAVAAAQDDGEDRKSTRLNSSHLVISYAVFCLKKKKKHTNITIMLSQQHIPK